METHTEPKPQTRLEDWKPWLADGPLGLDIPATIHLMDIRDLLAPRATADQMEQFEACFEEAHTNVRPALRKILEIVNQVTLEGVISVS